MSGMRTILALCLLVGFSSPLPTQETKSHFNIIHSKLELEPEIETTHPYSSVFGKSTYSSYEGEGVHFPVQNEVEAEPNLIPNPGFGSEPDSDLDYKERVFHIYILNREKEKAKKKKEEELKKEMEEKARMEAQQQYDYSSYNEYAPYPAPAPPLPPPPAPTGTKKELEKSGSDGYGARAALLLAFIVFIIYVFSYDAFDKITGLGRLGDVPLDEGGRAAPSRTLSKLFNMDGIFVNIIERINFAEVMFEAVGLEEEECRQMAFCNIRKVVNGIPQIENYLNVIGYASYIRSRYVKGDEAGARTEQNCKSSFPECQAYNVSL